MIPANIIQFLDNPLFAFAATRTSDLTPQVHFVCAWRVDSDTQMTFMVSDWSSHGLKDALDDNGQVAITLTLMPSHETYQFKGDGAEHRLPTETDLATFQTRRTALLPLFVQYGMAEEFVESALSPPALAVTFEVREIFLQTPGPGAGKRIAPEVA